AAFVEAELGLRPFRQLGSWIEWELFHKLRARVERTASGQYLAIRSGTSKVPSIIPIGVRAAPQTNGDWETSMTIRDGQRARTIATRLHRHRERCRVKAFEVGYAFLGAFLAALRASRFSSLRSARLFCRS